ncbi:unnamed protein product, partial [Didymodactylos carnosus]
ITKVKFSRPQTAGILEKESNECYKLNSQDPCTDEQYMLRQLDELYLHEERNWNFNEIQFQDKMNENAVWPAIVIRKHRIQNANEVQKQLQNQLVESRSSLKLSRARSGYSSTNQYPATQCIQRKVTIHLLIEQKLKYELRQEDHIQELLPNYIRPSIPSKSPLMRRERVKVNHWSPEILLRLNKQLQYRVTGNHSRFCNAQLSLPLLSFCYSDQLYFFLFLF